MYCSGSVNNFVGLKIIPKSWKNLIKRRKLSTAEVIKFQKPYEFQRNTIQYSDKPNHVPSVGFVNYNLFYLNSVKVRNSLIRKYSTNKDVEQVQFTKLQKVILYCANIDFAGTIFFFWFCYKDYNRYKEKGAGYIIKNL